MIDTRGIYAGATIRHFKREWHSQGFSYVYRFIAIAKHTETGEQFAVYQALYSDPSKGITIGDVFVRPAEMFFSEVDRQKYPDAKQKYRFQLLDKF